MQLDPLGEEALDEALSRPAATKHTSWLSGLAAVGRPEGPGPCTDLLLGELADGQEHAAELATVSIDST